MFGLDEVLNPLIFGAMLDQVQEQVPSPHVVTFIIIILQHDGVSKIWHLLQSLYTF